MAKFTKTKVLNRFSKNKSNTYLTFRSKWEYTFAIYLENSKGVKSWKFDFPFKYYDQYVTKKNTVYYIDFLVEMIDGTKVFFEVKPVSTLTEKVNTKSLKYKKIHTHNYLKNLSKFDSVVRYCQKSKMKFYLVDGSRKSFRYYRWDSSKHIPIFVQ